MPRKKDSASVVLFDANSSSTYKQHAIDCYKKICERMHLLGDNNLTSLFLANVEGKKRLTDYVVYNACNRKHLESAEGTSGDWLCDLQEAMDNLYYLFSQNGSKQFQVLVLSDLKTPTKLSKDEIKEKIEHIVGTLNENDGYIYFLGIDCRPENLLNRPVDVYNWVQSIHSIDNVNNPDVGKELNGNFSIATKIIKDAMGVICDFDIGIDLFMSYIEDDKGFPFVEPLTFTINDEELKLPSRVTKFMELSSSNTPKADNLRLNEKYVLLEDQCEEVSKENTQSGLILHENLITIPRDVATGLKNYNRFFKLLGFTDSKNVPNHYMINDGSETLINADSDKNNIKIIDFLVEAALKHDKYGIAVRAYMRNTMPKLFCLIPKPDPFHFLMVEIAYAEDFVLPYIENDIENFKVEGESCERVFDYLDSLNLDDKLKIHPNLRLSDSKKRLAEMNQDLREGRPLKQTFLVPFDIEFRCDPDLLRELEEKYVVKEEELEDLW